jgi:hypothetical protein
MARLCFAQTSNIESLALRGREDLLREAKATLEGAEMEPARPAAGTSKGRTANSARSVVDLVALLPPWTDADALIQAYATRWWGAHDAQFPPTWILKVSGMYRSNFQPSPHPHFLAELFAVFAVSSRGLATETGPADSRHADADRYAACTQRALDIGAYLDRPSLECIRALSLLVSCVGLPVIEVTDVAQLPCILGSRPRPRSHHPARRAVPRHAARLCASLALHLPLSLITHSTGPTPTSRAARPSSRPTSARRWYLPSCAPTGATRRPSVAPLLRTS